MATYQTKHQSHYRTLSRFFAALVLTTTLFLGSCGARNSAIAPPPGAAVETVTEEVPAAVQELATEESVKGGSLNSFFPANGDGYERVFVQEKMGFSQAKLKQNGEELGLLSINDLANNPRGVQKFEKATETLAGYPLVTVGSSQTALLVGDRYQVKVKSNAEGLTPDDRKIWLQKFDLSGLGQLK